MSSIPGSIVHAPVKWNYVGQTIPLTFYAGFLGAEQRANGTISPRVGWYITQDGKEDDSKKKKASFDF